MENQQKYQPLLEKILENLEAERGDSEPDPCSAKYGLEVPTLQSEAATSPRFVQHIPSNENTGAPHRAIGMRDESEVAGQDFTPFPAESTPEHVAEVFTQPLSDQSPDSYYEETQPKDIVPSETAPIDQNAHYLQTVDTEDQIPALFHREEPDSNGHNIPITKAFYGLTGAILIGAASVFYIMPAPKSGDQTTNKLAVAQSAIRLFPDGHNTKFGGDNNYTLSGEVTGESWEKGPQGNPLDITGKNPAINKTNNPTEMFAPINGPLEQLVSNIVKDLSPTSSPKPEPFGTAQVVNFDQTKDPAQTLNQLENSLENIVNSATSKLSAPAKQIVMAQANTKPSDNSARTTKAVPDKMRTLTNEVVEALSDLNGAESANSSSLNQSVDRLRATLSDLVQEAENQGKGAKSVKYLLEEAIGKNKQNLPAALKNVDGSLDISTLIASVVKRSDGKTKMPSADADYLALIENEGAKTALTSRIISQKGKARYLIVKAGDTLSSIAYATYGDAFAYPKIFNANKTIIRNANNLAIGMRLTIPR
ncbi:MAG: LysM peptidoglycan-binding domain-containing protein [bacterium]|nr:LysM peptidoglycan-binding domain-containing protein [bacterium]